MADKRISQLNQHTTPSGSDLLVIVNNNETKKITYADLIDGIASDNTAINNFTASYLIDSASFDNRIDTLENWSSSLTDTFATDLEVSIVSSSVAATIAVVSSAVGLVTTSSFNSYTASQSTSSLVSRLDAIENVSSSWITESETGSFLTSLNGAISSSEQVLGSSGVYSSSAQINGNIYSAGSSFTFQDLLLGAGTTFGKITTDGSKYISVMPTYNVESARFWPNGNVTIQDGGDYVDNGFRLDVSGSTRIVGSFNTIGGITGSTNFDTIVNKPTLISSSAQVVGILSSLNSKTGSYATTGSNTFYGDQIISGSIYGGNLNIAPNIGQNYEGGKIGYIYQPGDSEYTSSFIKGIIVAPSDQTTEIKVDWATAISICDNLSLEGYSDWYLPSKNEARNVAVYGKDAVGGFVEDWYWTSTELDASNAWRQSIGGGSNQGTISKSSTERVRAIRSLLIPIINTNVNLVGNVYIDSGSLNVSNGITGSTNFNTIVNKPTLISGSSQLTSSYDSRYVISGSIGSVPLGTISGSSQLTSSYDTRYTLSGSVQPLPSNLISGSSQLTSSFDTRYILSGSLTTGSNVSVSDTAPNSPSEGDLWWKSDDGNLYVYYDSYWVVATDTISAIPNGVISGSAQITTLGFVSGSYETTGRGIISGSAQLPSGLISGSSQLTTEFPSKIVGTWTLPTGASTQSFTVDANNSYTMWVNGNVPNGIINWNATATISNTNVPVVGAQYGWYYAVGNAIVLTAMPDQFVGTNGSILTSPGSYAPNTSNVFKFGITNNSGTTQTINYGYIKLS